MRGLLTVKRGDQGRSIDRQEHRSTLLRADHLHGPGPTPSRRHLGDSVGACGRVEHARAPQLRQFAVQIVESVTPGQTRGR